MPQGNLSAADLQRAKKGSQLEQSAALQMLAADLRHWKREGRLIPGRKFRFDFWFPKEKVILEVHGVYGKRSRHRTSKGFQQDRVKMNLAQLEGFVVIEAGSDHIKTGEFVSWVADALKSRRP